MGWDYTQEESDKWQLDERGGAQGDYRDGVSPCQVLPLFAAEAFVYTADALFLVPLFARCKRKLPM
jgi:hypothetical protein